MRKMGNGFKLDLSGIKEVLNQIYNTKPTFPITEKQVLIKALGGETQLVKINSKNETASAVLLAEEAFSNTQVFRNSNDIIDGIIGGSFINAVTKAKIYSELNELSFPIKHFRDLEKMSIALQLYGIQWEQVKERLDLPINSPAEIVLAVSVADPSVVSTDVVIIDNLELPDLAQMLSVKSPGTAAPPSAPGEPEGLPEESTAAVPASSETPAFIDDSVMTDIQQEMPAPSPGIADEPAASAPAPLSSGSEVEMRFGFSYLIKEDKPKQCFEIYSGATSAGVPGLCITRTHPRQIRTKFNLGDEKIHWLTDRKSSEEETLSPALESMVYLIQGFVKKNDKSVIVLDGLEYLISVNKFNPVLAFIRRLVDFISERDAAFLAPISPATIGEQELKTLEREMEPINADEILVLPADLSSTADGSGAASSNAAAADQSQPDEAGDTEALPSPQPDPDAQPAGDGTGCTPCESTGKCFWCSGTGKCESCQGTGKTSSGEACDNCGGSGDCDSCKGSKVCVWCKGTGVMVQQ